MVQYVYNYDSLCDLFPTFLQLQAHLTPVEITASILAAICHDLDHPGKQLLAVTITWLGLWMLPWGLRVLRNLALDTINSLPIVAGVNQNFLLNTSSYLATIHGVSYTVLSGVSLNCQLSVDKV